MKSILLCLLVVVAMADVTAQKKKKSNKPTLAFADSLFLKPDYKAAIPAYESILKEAANKSNAQTWNRLGLSYLNVGDYAKSILAFDEVYKLNPRFQFLFVNRAKAYSAVNDVSKSIQMLDSAVAKFGFGNFRVLETDPAFENLRKDSRYKQVYDKIYASAYPCLNLPEARQFDFWLGDWDVYLTSNPSVKTGFNRITQQSGGCVILESWEAQGPHRGVSINYYDPTSKNWNQKWAGSGQDITEFYEGKYENGAMRFKWDVPKPDGKFNQGRLTFTNMEPGKVRQHSEQSTDEGKTWQTVYDFTYIKRN
jgi:tetratricopeptide (TPR) repeat protein